MRQWYYVILIDKPTEKETKIRGKKIIVLASEEGRNTVSGNLFGMLIVDI